MIARGVFALVLAFASLGCSRAGVHDEGPWLADAARRHALADERLQAGNTPGAKQALLDIVNGAVPAGVAADDRRGVLQDTYFRLAELDLQARDARSALAAADRGLALGRADDLFVANLLVVRGAAHEALDEGPAAAADYHDALVINERLLAAALHERPSEAQP
jgi:hypothetical protein